MPNISKPLYRAWMETAALITAVGLLWLAFLVELISAL